MQQHKDSWVGDPERDIKVAHNRALRDLRIRLSGEHFAGEHKVYHEDCVECELAYGQAIADVI